MQVMGLLPECWSVEMLNEFLIRSLRQNYHDYREGQVLKGLCRGQNTIVIYIYIYFLIVFNLLPSFNA